MLEIEVLAEDWRIDGGTARLRGEQLVQTSRLLGLPDTVGI